MDTLKQPCERKYQMTKVIATLLVVSSFIAVSGAAHAAGTGNDFASRFFAERALNGS
jgi:hypothetical protein